MSQHRPIVVPLDGTPRAEEAIAFACDIANARGGPVHLIRVHRASHALRGASARSRAGVETACRIRQGELAYLRRVAGKLVTELGRQRVRAVLLEGMVAEAIVEYVREVNAAIVVIAPRRRQGVARSLLGGVSDYVIQYAPTPVLLVCHSPGKASRGGAFRKVLVPVTGESTEIVLRSASSLAPEHPLRFVLLHFVDAAHMLDVDGTVPRLGGRDRAEGARTMAVTVRRLLRTALSVRRDDRLIEVAARAGLTPRQAIAEVTAQAEPDLLAIAVPARTRFGRWFSGWETREVVGNTGLPVLAVGPRAAEGDQNAGSRQEAPSGPAPNDPPVIRDRLPVLMDHGWRRGWTRGSGRRRRRDPAGHR